VKRIDKPKVIKAKAGGAKIREERMRLVRFAQVAAMYGDGANLQKMAVSLLKELGEPWHY
jgi:acetyl-CoA carboxylase beta subunit